MTDIEVGKFEEAVDYIIEKSRAAGFEFACAHLCPHCKGGDVPERINQEQIDRIEVENKRRADYDWAQAAIEDHMWRHTKRKDEKSRVDITPLCKSSSLREAWRNENDPT